MSVQFSWFDDLLRSQNIEISQHQFQQFQKYFELLVEWNKVMNLTAITDEEQVFVKHFYDSLTLSQSISIQKVCTLVDVGSGAGFPSIPLKIMFPHLEITIVDSLGKRIKFLNHLVQELELLDVTLIHARAEDAARKISLRDSFDLATARAVARLNILHELCVPFVKVGGLFAAMKGTDPKDEVVEAKYSAKQLKCEYVKTDAYELPHEASQRNIVVYKKTGATPKQFPRKAGLPGKSPLLGSH